MRKKIKYDKFVTSSSVSEYVVNYVVRGIKEHNKLRSQRLELGNF